MASSTTHRAGTPNGRASGGTVPGETVDDTRADPTTIAMEALAELRHMGRVAVFRTAPSWAEGYCETLELQEGDTPDLEDIARSWGGGTYLLRPMVRDARGIFRFGIGGVRVKMQGEPRQRSRAEERAPVIVAPPAPATPPALEQLVVGLLERFDAQARQIAELRSAIEHRPVTVSAPAPLPPPPAAPGSPTDLVAQLRHLKRLHSELGGLFDAPEEDEEEEPKPKATGSIGGLEDRLVDVIARRLGLDDAAPPRVAVSPAPPSPPRPVPSPSPTAPAAGAAAPVPTTAAPASTPADPEDARPPTAASVIADIGRLGDDQRAALVSELTANIPPELLELALAERRKQS